MLCCWLGGATLWSQPPATTFDYCGSDRLRNRAESQSQRRKADRSMMDMQIARKTRDGALLRGQSDTATLTIPLVFHVLHDGGAEELSDARIDSAVQHLNEAFANAGTFAQPDGVETHIQFCLARRGRYGEPTNGIDRVRDARYVDLEEYEQDSMMRWRYAWPTDKVVNIYTVASIWIATAYATFPGVEEGNQQQAIVIEAEYVGADAASDAILAHEMGHYLGLYHTFAPSCDNAVCLLQGDRVCDTPPDNLDVVFEGCQANNNCDTDTDDRNALNPFREDAPDANDNFMDYNLVECMKSFTNGQRTRMRKTASLFRPRLLTSEYCNAVPYNHDAGIYEVKDVEDLVCGDSLAPRVRIINWGAGFLRSLELQYWVGEGPVASYLWRGQVGPDGSYGWVDLPPIALSERGDQELTVVTANPNNIADQFPRNDTFRVRFWRPHAGYLPLQTDFESGVPEDWVRLSGPGDRWALAVTGQCSVPNGQNNALYLRREHFSGSGTNRLVSPVLDLRGHPDPILRFDHAYVQQSDLIGLTEMSIAVIPYCTLDAAETVYTRGVLEIIQSIRKDLDYPWVPTTCRDWTTDTVDLSAYTGQQVVLVLSTNIGSGERDWLYLDNFRVESSFTREKAESGLQPEDISLYPNPNNGAFTLEFQSYREQQLRLSLYDLHGRKLWGSVEQIGEGRIQKRIDERGLATGMYFLRMRIGELEFMRKVTVYF